MVFAMYKSSTSNHGANKMKSTSLNLRDSQGRTLELFINGDSIQELINEGYPEFEAEELVTSNAFEVAIRMGEIGSDAWIG
jgi:hypothetical protein